MHIPASVLTGDVAEDPAVLVNQGYGVRGCIAESRKLLGLDFLTMCFRFTATL